MISKDPQGVAWRRKYKGRFQPRRCITAEAYEVLERVYGQDPLNSDMLTMMSDLVPDTH